MMISLKYSNDYGYENWIANANTKQRKRSSYISSVSGNSPNCNIYIYIVEKIQLILFV